MDFYCTIAPIFYSLFWFMAKENIDLSGLDYVVILLCNNVGANVRWQLVMVLVFVF